MGRGDFGFDGLHSLKAVDQWIAVINSNLSSVSRVGYKGSKVKFKGGVTEVFRSPAGSLQGIQLPESTISIDETNIDFSQGSVINSSEPTHLAIQGTGFFGLATGPGSSPTFYTRDGEFHLDTNTVAGGRLINSAGLYLVSSGGCEINMCNLQGFLDETLGAAGGPSLLNSQTPQFLEFSEYGSTVFQVPSGINMAALPSGTSNLLGQSLETSNASLSQSIPELSLAQKFFSSITKVISVHQTNLDTVINLIR